MQSLANACMTPPRLSASAPVGSARKTAGFTLVEMAVVLVIVGLLLGGLLVPLSTQMENDRRKESAATLEAIREALIGYAVINGRLPCPDTNGDGREDACGNGANQSHVAGLPYGLLGVSRTDAWGNGWRYAVNGGFTATFSRTTAGAGGGRLQVTNANGCGGTVLADNVPALVVSNAKTSHGGTLEPENRDPDRCFVDAGYTSTANGFDDLLVWIAPGALINRLVAAGTL